MSEATRLSAGGGEAAVFSAPAPGRTSPNEDAAAVLDLGPTRAVLAVADGVGGQASGARASALALRALARSLAGAAGGDSLRESILDAVESASREILALGTGAATTLVVVEIDGEWLRPYHVGDSAALVVGGRGRLKLQTVAHSPVGYAVESGLLDEEEALHHAERHVISNSVGDPEMRIEVGSPLRLAARDTVLLASDGLLDNLGVPELLDETRRRPLARAARALAAAARARMDAPAPGQPSKPDDVTFVLWRRSARRARPAGGGSEQGALAAG